MLFARLGRLYGKNAVEQRLLPGLPRERGQNLRAAASVVVLPFADQALEVDIVAGGQVGIRKVALPFVAFAAELAAEQALGLGMYLLAGATDLSAVGQRSQYESVAFDQQ